MHLDQNFKYDLYCRHNIFASKNKDLRLLKIPETISMHIMNNSMHAPDTVAVSVYIIF